jgi:hypothetical protein
MRTGRDNKRIARLTVFEDKCWVFAFSYHLDNKKGSRVADQLAWRDLQREFPRLRRFAGCR